MKKELVSEWMSSEVITVTPETSLPELHKLMLDYTIRRLPVVRNGQLVGIVTLGDVRQAEPSRAVSLNVWEMTGLLSKLRVEAIMTANPITIDPFKTIGDAAAQMLDYKISGLPVVDANGRVAGIITESDIFSMVVRKWNKTKTSTVGYK